AFKSARIRRTSRGAGNLVHDLAHLLCLEAEAAAEQQGARRLLGLSRERDSARGGHYNPARGSRPCCAYGRLRDRTGTPQAASCLRIWRVNAWATSSVSVPRSRPLTDVCRRRVSEA